MNWDKFGRWVAWLIILITVMYFGAHIIASVMVRSSCP